MVDQLTNGSYNFIYKWWLTMVHTTGGNLAGVPYGTATELLRIGVGRRHAELGLWVAAYPVMNQHSELENHHFSWVNHHFSWVNHHFCYCKLPVLGESPLVNVNNSSYGKHHHLFIGKSSRAKSTGPCSSSQTVNVYQAGYPIYPTIIP